MTTLPPLDAFSTELLPGETIEWAGRPNAGVIFHREDWLMVPFSLIWGGFPFFWLFQGVFPHTSQNPTKQHFDLFGAIIGLLFLLIGQYLIWGRFVYQWWEKKRTTYAITNRRALIVVDVFNRTVSSAFFDRLSIVDKKVRSDGIGCVSFGGPVISRLAMGRRSTNPRPPTFDDIDNADSVYQLALRLQGHASNSCASAFRY